VPIFDRLQARGDLSTLVKLAPWTASSDEPAGTTSPTFAGANQLASSPLTDHHSCITSDQTSARVFEHGPFGPPLGLRPVALQLDKDTFITELAGCSTIR
jgi:hypothetical protein